MRFVAIVLGFIVACGTAVAQTGAGGFVYGQDHAYFLQAPKAWVMDAGDASQEGVGAVFHPQRAHWPASNVIIYTDFLKKTKRLQTPGDALRADVARFKEDGSAIRPLKEPSIKTNIGGLVGDVYYFGPDKRGQFDARAYFSYEGYIDYFVLTARDKETFDKSKAAFGYVIKSYTPQLKVIQEKVSSKKT